MLWLVLIAAAFLAGSVPFGHLIARAKGVDIRAHGSGNIGATNVGRVLGRKFGILCFALDALKGALPVVGAGLATGILGLPIAEIGAERLWLWLAVGAAALLGHMFSPWIGFKGGKGVATGFGALLAMWSPLTIPALCAFVIWFVVLRTIRMMSIASIAGAWTIPTAVALRAGFASEPSAAFAAALPATIATAAIALLVTVKHRANLARALRGEERTVNFR
jgi:glycerol-3-phosphate acyltransferase PlsY